MALDGKLYLTATNGKIGRITGQSLTRDIRSYSGLDLPEQVDGESIFYQSSSILNVSISEVNGILYANVSGGSGNYSYTWNTPNSPEYGVGSSLTPCGTYTHRLVVRYNVLDCVTGMAVYYFYKGRACEKRPPLDFAFRKTNSTILSTGQIELYPNPARSFVNVQVGAGEKIMQLHVTNLKGQHLLQKEGSKGSFQRLSINGLKSGTYFITIVTDKSNNQMKLLVK